MRQLLRQSDNNLNQKNCYLSITVKFCLEPKFRLRGANIFSYFSMSQNSYYVVALSRCRVVATLKNCGKPSCGVDLMDGVKWYGVED